MALLVIMWRSSPFVLVFLVNDALVSLRRLQWWRHLLVLLALYMSHNKQARDCWCFVSTWYQEIMYCAFAHGLVNMWWTSPFVLVFDTDALSLRRLHWWRHLLVLLLTLYMLSHNKQARDCCLGLNCLLSPRICHVAWLMFVQLLCWLNGVQKRSGRGRASIWKVSIKIQWMSFFRHSQAICQSVHIPRSTAQ